MENRSFNLEQRLFIESVKKFGTEGVIVNEIQTCGFTIHLDSCTKKEP
jgi:hypothetical protein